METFPGAQHMGQLEQVRRMIKLRQYLNCDPAPDAEHIARLLRVSRRTLYRDMNLLRDAELRLNPIAEIVDHVREVATGNLTPHEAACLQAVFKHECCPDAGSSHARVWEKLRRRFTAVIDAQTRHCRDEVDKYLQAILAARPLTVDQPGSPLQIRSRLVSEKG